MQIVRELKGAELILTAMTMLMGEEGVDYALYEEDEDWWAVRLWTRRN